MLTIKDVDKRARTAAIERVFTSIRDSAIRKTSTKASEASDARRSLNNCVRALARLLRQESLLLARRRVSRRREVSSPNRPTTLASLVCGAMRRFGAPVRLLGCEALQNMAAYTDIAHDDVGAAIIPELLAALRVVIDPQLEPESEPEFEPEVNIRYPKVEADADADADYDPEVEYEHNRLRKLELEGVRESERVLTAQSAAAALWNVVLLDNRVCATPDGTDVKYTPGRRACVRALIDAGALPIIVATMRAFPEVTKLLYYACGLLAAAALCTEAHQRAALFDADSVLAVVEVLSRTEDELAATSLVCGYEHTARAQPQQLLIGVRMLCLEVLHNILAPLTNSTMETRGAVRVREAGGVAGLLRVLCSAASTPQLFTLVTIALWNACLDDDSSRALMASHATVCALARAVNKCRDSSNVVGSCIGLLYIIAVRGSDMCAAIRNAHVLRAVLESALVHRTSFEVRRNLCTLVAVVFNDCDADSSLTISAYAAAFWHYACATFTHFEKRDLAPFVVPGDECYTFAAHHFMLLATACAAMRALGKSGMPLSRHVCCSVTAGLHAPSLTRMVLHVLVAMEDCGAPEQFARLQCEATVDALLGRRNTPTIVSADIAIREHVLTI